MSAIVFRLLDRRPVAQPYGIKRTVARLVPENFLGRTSPWLRLSSGIRVDPEVSQIIASAIAPTYLAGSQIISHRAADSLLHHHRERQVVVFRDDWPVPLKQRLVMLHAAEAINIDNFGVLPDVIIVSDGCVFRANLCVPAILGRILLRQKDTAALLAIFRKSQDQELLTAAIDNAVRLNLALDPARLRELYNRFENPELRRAVLTAMAKLPGHDDFFRPNLTSQNEALRSAALLGMIAQGYQENLLNQIDSLLVSQAKVDCLDSLAEAQGGNPAALRIFLRFARKEAASRFNALGPYALIVAAKYFGFEGKKAVVRFLANLPEAQGLSWAEEILPDVPKAEDRPFLVTREYSDWLNVFAADRKQLNLSPLTWLWVNAGNGNRLRAIATNI